jgi:hypothetical protein
VRHEFDELAGAVGFGLVELEWEGFLFRLLKIGKVTLAGEFNPTTSQHPA